MSNLFRDEVMTNLPSKEHKEEHKEINKLFDVDCDNLTVEEHLRLHIEFQYHTGKLNIDEYIRYSEYANNGIK